MPCWPTASITWAHVSCACARHARWPWPTCWPTATGRRSDGTWPPPGRWAFVRSMTAHRRTTSARSDPSSCIQCSGYRRVSSPVLTAFLLLCFLFQAGITLARALMNLTARLCDGTLTAPTSAARATEAVLPVLLQQGLTHPAREVRAVSIQTLIRVVKTAGPLLRPHLAALLTALLEGESTLEPQMFSYLQHHTASLGLSDEELEKRRLAAAQRASPLHECVQLCLAQVGVRLV